MTQQNRVSYEESDRYADLNGVRIHYNEAGSGPMLIGFHGGGPGANGWDNTKWNIDGLSEHFHVVLMDMPGYGHSDKGAVAKEGESQDRYWARLIKEFLDFKGVEKTNLYGSSASGPGVLRFGLEYPDRIEKIVLQSSGVGGPPWFATSPPDGIRALGVFQKEPTFENMTAMMQLFVPNSELLTEQMINDRFNMAMVEGHLASRERRGLGNADQRSEIGKLQAPVLLVWGRQDHMVPVEGALDALAHIPNLRLHIWGGTSGHFVQYEHAAEFNRLVIDFLTHD